MNKESVDAVLPRVLEAYRVTDMCLPTFGGRALEGQKRTLKGTEMEKKFPIVVKEIS